MKIIIIANCHVQPIAYLLELNRLVHEVITLPIHLSGSEQFIKSIQKIESSDDEYVVLQFIGLVEKVDFTNSARARFIKILTFTNLYFTGYHPDCCYVGGMGVRVPSPLGDYHSKLCYLSFAKGYSVDKCCKLFREDVFESLGYNTEWDKSSQELLHRDFNVDIRFATDFLKLSESVLTLLTINHPTALVFFRLVEMIASKLMLDVTPIPIDACPNFLYSNAVWPVYPANCKFIASDKSIDFKFKSPDNIRKKIYSLEEFVAASYLSYAEISLEKMQKPYFQDMLIDEI